MMTMWLWFLQVAYKVVHAYTLLELHIMYADGAKMKVHAQCSHSDTDVQSYRQQVAMTIGAG